MAKEIILKHKGGPYGDECSDYEFNTSTIMTLKDFAETIAADKKEWGYIKTSCFEEPLVEYSHGKITYYTDKFGSLVTPRGSANGGWSRMDYIIKLM